MVGSHIQAMCEAFESCKSKGREIALLRETFIVGSVNSLMLQNLGNLVIDKDEKAGLSTFFKTIHFWKIISYLIVLI